VNNPSSLPVPLVLGASIRPTDGGSWINDPANDRRVVVQPGVATLARPFRVPPTTLSGRYDVAWGLVGDERQNFGFQVAPGILTVTPTAAVVPTPETSPPKGALILVQRTENGANALVRLSLVDGVVSPLYAPATGWAWAPSVSPDGSLIALSLGTPGRADIATLRVDGTGLRVLARSRDGLSFGSPWWMPDGRIGIGGASGEWGEIYAVAAGGGEPTQLTSTPGIAGTRLPTWPMAGGPLAFAGKQDGRWRIFVMGQNGMPRAVSPSDTDAYAPAWSPDGRSLAFQSGHGVGIVAPDGSRLRYILPAVEDVWRHSPAWSPDGAWIAVVSNQAASLGADYGDVFVVPSEGGQPVQVSSGGTTYDWRAAWIR